MLDEWVGRCQANINGEKAGSLMKAERDIEKTYSNAEFVAKLRRLADAIENGDTFETQIAGERIYVPVRAIYNIEHEREDGEEEIEFQVKWESKGQASSAQATILLS